KKLKNIHFLGAKDYSSLPSYLKGFDVALLPNNINSYTDNMFPMKFFEYLAAGRNVVSVNLPSIKEFSEYFKLTNNDNDFIQAIESILLGDSIELDKIQLLAKQFTYDT
ncbi:glycosyltransferase, partial [Klebsiella pneumoniae]